ncbi:hypothetical protein SAMN04515620_1265 [Collimonas sp. OK607]|nr:hypothetical protein SAMN04515620_1265 [Collimonas sp. OK607]
MNSTEAVVGVDIEKQVFQLRWIDAETAEVFRKQVKRCITTLVKVNINTH